MVALIVNHKYLKNEKFTWPQINKIKKITWPQNGSTNCQSQIIKKRNILPGCK